MSGRVCYLARSGRTDGHAVVRLVGPGSDESWDREGAPEDPLAAIAHTGEAAAWVAQRAAQGDGPRHEIDVLCVDIGGATCAWLTAPSSEESVITAVIAQGGGEWAGAGTDVAAGGGTWAPATTAEASVQALAPPPAHSGRPSLLGRRAPGAAASKFAVTAVPDVDARLFIDALDERGVTVDRAVSLWHALAVAWDPAGPGAAGSLHGEVRGSVVASSAPTTAVVLIDPAGRLAWAWSRAGELLAAGTIRLVLERREAESSVVLGLQEVGRLAADWLSWSVQLGVVPARVVCVGPRSEGHESLSPSALGAALTRAWPGATVDLAVHDDPIGATLRRLAGMETPPVAHDGRMGLVSLSRRPGRAHRAMYIWGSICILAVAVALGAVAWKAFRAKGLADARRDETNKEIVASVSKVAAPANSVQQATLEASPSAYLTDQLNKRRAALNPNSGLEPAEPILSELETISYPLGTRDIEITHISLLNSGAMLDLIVPDTETGELLRTALVSVGSHCMWQPPSFSSIGPNQKGRPVSFLGKWKDESGTKP